MDSLLKFDVQIEVWEFILCLKKLNTLHFPLKISSPIVDAGFFLVKICLPSFYLIACVYRWQVLIEHTNNVNDWTKILKEKNSRGLICNFF